jgi:hypothetical protein
MHWTADHLRRIRNADLRGYTPGETAARVQARGSDTIAAIDLARWVMLGRTDAQALAKLNSGSAGNGVRVAG